MLYSFSSSSARGWGLIHHPLIKKFNLRRLYLPSLLPIWSRLPCSLLTSRSVVHLVALLPVSTTDQREPLSRNGSRFTRFSVLYYTKLPSTSSHRFSCGNQFCF